MRLKDIYRQLARVFFDAGLKTPELDARLLLAELAGLKAAQVPLSEHELTQEQQDCLENWRARRLKHESVARIAGRRGFWTVDLEVSKAVLEPRPDSETLIEAALAHLGPRRNDRLKILDLGTGSGALLLSLLYECPQAFGVGVDLSLEAVRTAQRNAVKNNLATRAGFVCADWLGALSGTFDLMVANPPYIRSAEFAGLEDEVRLYDPHLALDGGLDGLDAYRALAANAANNLEKNGLFLLEVGYDQSKAVAELFEHFPFRLRDVAHDLAGHRRVVVFELQRRQKTFERPLENACGTAKTMQRP